MFVTQKEAVKCPYFYDWIGSKLSQKPESRVSSVDNIFKLKCSFHISSVNYRFFFMQPLNHAICICCHFITSRCSSAVHWNAIMLCRHVETIAILPYIHPTYVCQTITKMEENGRFCLWNKNFYVFRIRPIVVWLDKHVK